jgi:replication factor C subunit 2/4
VQYEDGAIEKLIDVSEGDLRRAVTYLQSSFNLTSAAATASTKGKRGKKIIDDDSDEEMTDASAVPTAAVVTVCTIEEVAGVIPPKTIQDLVSAMQPGVRGTVYGALSKQVTDIVADGWSANQVLAQLYTTILADETIELRKKTKILSIFSEVDKRLVDGGEEQLAILDLSLRVAAVLGEKK